jgi:hypothetical protein
VGSVFNIKVESGIKRFRATCGDLGKPCPLNIDIEYGERIPYNVLLDKYPKEMEEIKMKIIILKNELMFFRKNLDDSETMHRFDDLSAELKELSGLIGSLTELNILTNYNPEKYALIATEIESFLRDCVAPFKENLRLYLQTDDNAHIHESIRIYNEDMKEKLDKIRKLKYKICFVEFDSATTTYTLVQKEHTLEDLEYYDKTEDKINAFILGNKVKTRKLTSNKTVHNSTKKVRKHDTTYLEDEDEGDDLV